MATLNRTLAQPKKLVWFVALLLLTITAARGADVLYNFNDFTDDPVTVKKVDITPLWTPAASGGSIIVRNRKSYTNDLNGSLTITNMLAGTYRVEFYGSSFAITQFTNLIPDTNITINAADYLTGTIQAGGTVAWSASVSDARYIFRTNGTAYGTFKYTNASTANGFLLQTDSQGNTTWTNPFSSQFQLVGNTFSLSNNANLGTNHFIQEPTINAAILTGNATAAALNISDIFTLSGQAPSRFLTLDAGNRIATSGTSANLIATLTDETGSGAAVFSASPTFTGTITAAAITASDNIVISTAGNGLQIKTGSNAKMGKATLLNGTVTVSTTAVTADSHIFLTKQNDGQDGGIGWLNVGTVVAGTSFVIECRESGGPIANDDSVVAWMIVEPAP